MKLQLMTPEPHHQKDTICPQQYFHAKDRMYNFASFQTFYNPPTQVCSKKGIEYLLLAVHQLLSLGVRGNSTRVEFAHIKKQMDHTFLFFWICVCAGVRSIPVESS